MRPNALRTGELIGNYANSQAYQVKMGQKCLTDNRWVHNVLSAFTDNNKLISLLKNTVLRDGRYDTELTQIFLKPFSSSKSPSAQAKGPRWMFLTEVLKGKKLDNEESSEVCWDSYITALCFVALRSLLSSVNHRIGLSLCIV